MRSIIRRMALMMLFYISVAPYALKVSVPVSLRGLMHYAALCCY